MKQSEDTGIDAGRLRAMMSAHPGETDAAWLERVKKEYPFFTLPELLAMKPRTSDAERLRVAADTALSVADASALERLADPDGTRFDGFYPHTQTPKSPTTNQAIDKFLETYGKSDDAETETLEKLIFNPVADYSQQLARQEEASLPEAVPTGDSQTDRINRFILSVRGKDHDADVLEGIPTDAVAPVAAEQASASPAVKKSQPQKANKNIPSPTDNSLLSESLAKIYVKTGRYERAYEILSRLSLAFPEKNAYFADQLRFLRKLMFVESYRKKSVDNNLKSE